MYEYTYPLQPTCGLAIIITPVLHMKGLRLPEAKELAKVSLRKVGSELSLDIVILTC